MREGFQNCSFHGGPHNGMKLEVAIDHDQVCFAEPVYQRGLSFKSEAAIPVRKSVYTRSNKQVRQFYFSHWE